ncbi:MAG: cupredoxin family copper-binding protein [Actinobacteria bacterium]|nr:cupredoxin family copper-binding protein [Actinomycetota bacterium]
MINRIKIFSVVLVLLMILLATYGCYTQAGTVSTKAAETQGQQSSESAAATATETQAPATGNKITIQNFAFNPSEIQIKVGETVTWTNMDSAPHTIKSDSFNSSTLNNGDSFSFTFDKSGNYDYSCGIHPNMKGKIIVE